ncbi:MAG: metalloregulator ArsR/SmtB family transcription factor [Deltaproteobacteria bacterium]|nr:metalloregulator ArsR/SmtB family transcription factor [Deltaproteobacteria bacterium]
MSRLFKALADETRLRIVALLAHGELCVCHVQSGLAVSQPTASRALALLRAAGVVEDRRAGTWVYYRLAAQAEPARRRHLQALVRGFAGDAALGREVAALVAQKGPRACK